ADVPLFTGRLPSEAETRVLLAALGTRAESERGAPGGPHGRPDQLSVDRDSLREALALGDWATSWETVLGDRGVRFLGSPLHSYQAMVREYTTGSWDEALRLARSIVTGPGATAHGALYVCSRSIAADICRWQGDPVRAAAWLENVSGSTDHGPLPHWSLLGLRAGADASGARRQGWRDYRALKARGHVAGMERLLLRVVEYAVRADAVQDARTALGAMEDLDARVGSRHTRATTLLARAYVHGDVDSAVESYGPLARYGGTELAFLASAWLLDATGDENWLLAAVRWSEGMSSKLARRRLTLLAQQKGLSFPRRRGDRSVLSGLELTVIEKVVAGWTNRQISVALARSEKSVEAYLARIFESTGCRTRMELAKRWLDGDLQAYVPA
ncbi:helix-turn-helix transcriptional regulator, partial [Streptomyces olivaceus]